MEKPLLKNPRFKSRKVDVHGNRSGLKGMPDIWRVVDNEPIVFQHPKFQRQRGRVQHNKASIPSRYPENLLKLQQTYSEAVVKNVLFKGQEVIIWIKGQL